MKQFGLADIYGSYPQTVGIRMLVASHYFAYDYTLQCSGNILIRLQTIYLKTTTCKQVGNLSGRQIGTYKFF